MAENDKKRELALAPGTYAYVQDGTNGRVKTHVGPCTLTLTNQDKPVKFNTTTYRFDECQLDDAVQQNIVAPEGHYVVLLNPAKRTSKAEGASGATTQVDWHPEQGSGSQTPEFNIGEKENVPGPVSFALWPGQMAEVRRGHHLRLNEYLRIKIYNDEKAKQNWSKAVVKTTDETAGTPVAGRLAPVDIAVGKQYNIAGNEVSFYMPPTGVSVVPNDDETGDPFVRDAETLEQLEYSILVDEDGNKDYPRGPMVVFPRPTQQFVKDSKGNRKFRAVELNELQGIHLKGTKEVEMTFADGVKHKFAAGEEFFITGKEMPIYFPEEGHQLVRYDGKTVHYAVSVPEGGARYVMDRKTSQIETKRGPTMLLPNPVSEIIVRRALSDGESVAMFPGPDGMGSASALEYNRWLRGLSGSEPTTRQGVVSDGSVERSLLSGPQASLGAPSANYLASTSGSTDDMVSGGFEAMSFATSNASPERSAKPRRMAKGAMVPESRQGKSQEAMVGDVAERKSTYHEPRTLTFANDHKHVPTIKLQQGYACQVADADGKRRVEVGPKTILLEYAESLDVLRLSTGKPKVTDRLFTTAYLNISNNTVSDVVEVETTDHVKVNVRLAYKVSFEGDQKLWFSIENYVKHMCDHARSVLKGKVKKVTIEEFYSKATDMIRDYILGANTNPDGSPSKRSGMLFTENGMRITDVEVLFVGIVDQNIGNMLANQQRLVVEQNLQLAQSRQKLAMVKAIEDLKQQEALAVTETFKKANELEGQKLTSALTLDLDRLGADIQRQEQLEKVTEAEQAIIDLTHARELYRRTQLAQVDAGIAKEHQDRDLEMINARTEAIIEQMKAVDPALVAALESASARDTLVQVARSLSFHEMFGGENAADFLTKILSSGPLAEKGKKLLQAAAGAINGQQGQSNKPLA